MDKMPITRIAALADLHVRSTDAGRWAPVFNRACSEADVLLICGDLTDSGDEAEAKILAADIATCTKPVICIPGNHDFEKGRQKLIRQLLQAAGAVILEGESVVLGNVGFAGVKGFGGGFGTNILTMFGEDAVKDFVQLAVSEALNLERALAKLDADPFVHHKIVLSHYSPAVTTLKGEPEQLYPFLGSSRLAEPIARNYVTACFHGHAHNGVLHGSLDGNIPVFNVSRQVLAKENYPKEYFLYKLEAED